MYTSLLFKYLGPSVFWGVAVLLSVIPVNGICLRILDRLARGENEARDARTKRTAESITNMKLLKVQAWENQFAEEIRKHRKDELDRHKLRGIVRGINAAISNAVPALVLVVTLTAYARTGRPIVASTIFTAISLFNQLRFPLFFYPMLIDSLANGKNSLRRISSYLNSEELTPYVETLPHTGSGSIEMKNGNFLWSTSQAPKQGEVAPPESPALCNVNLKVNPGEIVAVVGPVGSGKSALIEGLLGELAPVPRMVVSDPFTDVSNTDDLIDKPSVTLHGNVAYCSQEAWLPKGTLRDAVVFGREYDESRYLAAIRDAGLDNDIVSNSGVTSKLDASGGLLSHNTDVGEGGSSLSGGQRARVALARALYGGEDTKVFLLDDCLAALDARVGSLVFERLIRRLKASNAATVFVTNDPSLPRRCDRVVLMGPSDRAKSSSSSCSTIVDMGTYDELLDRGHNIQSFSSSNDSEEDRTLPLRPEKEKGEISQSHDIKIERMVAEADTIRIPGGYKVMANDTDLSCHADPECQEIDLQNSPDYISERVVPIDPEDEARVNADRPALNSTGPIGQGRQTKLISADETMSTEAVPFSTYTSYLKAIRSPTLIFGMLAAFATVSGAQFFQQYTVMKWTELARDDAMAAALGSKYLRSLFGAACVVSVSLWFRSFFTMMVGVRASDFLHDRMVSSVFRAPMSFFDATPSGQLLSRFGKEIGIIDRTLPDNYASVLWCALQVVSSAMAIAGAITPAMALPLFFAGSLYVKTMKKFRPAARDMKRSETMTRSPIFTHFGEALRGAEIIRSTPGATKTWSTTHRTLSDINLSVYATVKALDRWLSCSLENLGNSLVLTAAVACVFLSRAGRLKAGAAGWGLTQSLSITGLMAWAIRNLTSLETHMMSVMRVKELTDLDSEEAKVELHPGAETEKFTMPRELIEPGEALKAQFPKDVCLNTTVTPLTEAALKADGWPWKGGVRFKNVSMRYNPLSPLVLKDLSVSVPPGSTLGVVGRTGSGKSSMLLTLFRIVEIEGVGRIELDGVDIRSVSIQTLRERLSIIPRTQCYLPGRLPITLMRRARHHQKVCGMPWKRRRQNLQSSSEPLVGWELPSMREVAILVKGRGN